MAYMSQETKKKIAPQIKALLKEYGLKGSLSVQHHSKLVLTISKGGIDFISEYCDGLADEHYYSQEGNDKPDNFSVNTYHIDSHFKGSTAECLNKLKEALNGKGTDTENFDKSDIMTDYFHVGWYIDISVGKWNKPYDYTNA